VVNDAFGGSDIIQCPEVVYTYTNTPELGCDISTLISAVNERSSNEYPEPATDILYHGNQGEVTGSRMLDGQGRRCLGRSTASLRKFGKNVTISRDRVRLVVDINVLLSSLMGGALSGLSAALADSRFQVFTSTEQLAELLDVVKRPKFRKYFTLNEARPFFADYCLITESAVLQFPLPKACRDPKDD